MDHERQQREIEQNYDAFQRMLRAYLQQQANRYALMREGQVVGFYDTPDEADFAGVARFPDQIYSIQQVTEEPVDLGIYAHGLG